jgi:serine/threonine protein kinase
MQTQPPQTQQADLIERLTAARLLDRGQAVLAVAQAKAAAVEPDEAALADFLVRRGLITRHQADQALTGELGRLAVGSYLLQEPLGTGGLGTVYKAVRRSDRKPYAVKVLPPGRAWSILTARSLVGPAAGLSAHPAVVPCADLDTADGAYFLAWPFVEGESFERIVGRSGPIEPARAAALAAEVADGLAVCHRHGVSHGRVKPSNLLVGKDGKARVLELGLGVVLAESVTDPASLVDARPSGGWVDCAAPEVLADPTRLAPAGDAYGLGCALYFLLTGSYPFPDGTAADKMAAHRTAEPVPVQTRRPQVTAGLADLVARLMRKDPADRPADLAAVRDALLKAAKPPVQPAPPAPPSGVALARPVAKRADAPPPAPPSALAPPQLLPVARSEVELWPAAGEEPTVTKEDQEEPQPKAVPTPTTAKPSFWRKMTKKVFPWSLPPEPIQISVFGPTQLPHGDTTKLQVFAHPPEAVAQVRAKAWEGMPEGGLLASCYTAEPIPRGGEIWVHLAADGVVVTHPMAKFPWTGEDHLAPFLIHVPSWSRTVGTVPATLTIGLNGYEVAVIKFDLTVPPRPPAEK